MSNDLLMILKDVLRHWMGAKRRVVFVGFADYSGLVVEAHLQITLNLIQVIMEIKKRVESLQRFNHRRWFCFLI